jgi:redox-sensitive bicupin YhaK (pirin superfamily)
MEEPLQVIAAVERKITERIQVRRALPTAKRRMIGQFVFLDHMGPSSLDAVDVPPHPHIGLATVTYLFEGELLHRDSLGFVQPIRPGAVNWMTAGRGIAHSERTPSELRGKPSKLHAIQLWVALPKEHEEDAPSFSHTPAEALPVIDDRGLRVRVVLGTFHGKTSSVKVLGEMFYAAAELEPGARLPLPPIADERAAYVAEGSLQVAGIEHPAGTLLVFRKGDEIEIGASSRARIVLLGGPPADGPRHIWWNFVSSSRERIDQAKADWREGRFAVIPGESEKTPLPDR